MDVVLYAGLLLLVLYRLLVAMLNAIFPDVLQQHAEGELSELSLLVPVRNEHWQLDELWQSLLPLYNELKDLVIYDDQSSDATWSWLEAKAAEFPKLRVIKGTALPAGWQGKQHACHQLALAASGRYLLFVDADVRVDAAFIKGSLGRLQRHRLTLLSAFPQQHYGSWGEALWVAMMPNMLLSWLWLKGRNLWQHPLTATANGQFMLFDGVSYRINTWHQACKAQTAEDLAIARTIARSGGQLAVVQAQSGLHCRMYRHGKEAFLGLVRNVVPALGSWQMAFLGWVLQASAWVWLAVARPHQLPFLFLLLFISRIFVLLASRENWRAQLLLWPLQQLAWQFLWCFGIYAHLTRRIRWKDRPVR